MMIDPALVVATVRAAVRVYHAADRSLAQHYRDRAMEIPGAKFLAAREAMDAATLQDAFDNRPGFGDWIKSDAEWHAAYDRMLSNDRAALDRMRLLFEAFKQKQDLGDDAAKREDFVRLEAGKIENWLKKGQEPVAPWTSFAITFADITVEFVAANPQIVVDSEDTAALLGAFAGSISKLLPDDGQFGKQQDVGNRLMGVLLRAGLETLAANRELLFDKKRVQELVNGSLAPIIEAFPDDPAKELKWERISDAVMGPAISEAFRIVADNPEAFLGERFDSEKLVGALTKDLFDYVADTGLDDTLSREGAIGLYTTALGVIVEQPELVLEGDRPRDAFFRDLLAEVAATLKNDPLEFDKAFGVRLAQATLSSLGGNAARLLRLGDKPWEKVAAGSLEMTLKGLKDGIGDKEKLKALFTQAQLIELFRLIAEQAAVTPEMITGDSEELGAIVSAVAAAMKQDEKLLLSGKDWLEIVAVALDEAGRNPGRLFGFKTDTPEKELGALLISDLLREASKVAQQGREGGGVLFGPTLKTAIRSTLRVASSNSALTAKALKIDGQPGETVVTLLIQEVSEVVAMTDEDKNFALGSKEWLRLFRALLPKVIAEGVVPELVKDGKMTPAGANQVKDILSGGKLPGSP